MNNFKNNPVPPNAEAFWVDFTEKRRINKTAWAVTLPGVVFSVVTVFLSVIIIFVGTKMGYSLTQISEFVSNPAVSELLGIVLSIFFMTVPFIIFCKIVHFNISASGGFNRPKKKTAAPYLMFGIGFCAFANVAVAVAEDWFKDIGIDYSLPQSKQPEGVFGFLLALISTAIIPALVEEFAFRGIVIGVLRPFGDAFAIIATSAIFGLLHGNFEQMPFAFLVGMVLGLIRIKTDSIIICMIVHGANNLIAVLLSYVEGIPTPIRSLIYTLYLITVLVLAVTGTMLLKNRGEFSLSPPERKISAKKTYVYFFFSPAMILLTLISLFRALSFVFKYVI